MAAQAAAPNRSESQQRDPSLVALGRAVLVAAVSVSLLVAGWLVLRRFAGTAQRPLELPALAAVGATVITITLAVRMGWQRIGGNTMRLRSLGMFLGLSSCLTVLLVALAVSIPGTDTIALTFFWGALLAEEGLWWLVGWKRGRPSARQSRASGSSGQAVSGGGAMDSSLTSGRREPLAAGALADAACDDEFVEDDGELPDDVSQQLTRSYSEQEGDTVAGVLRSHFQPGERSRSLHVVFCPPMKSVPKVDVIQMTGPQSRVKAADVQQFGVRFDLRLAASSRQSENVLIHFEARAVDPSCEKHENRATEA